MYFASATVDDNILKQSYGYVASPVYHWGLNFWQLYDVCAGMPWLLWSCCWWEDGGFLHSWDGRDTSVGPVAFGDFCRGSPESRHRQEHPLGLAGLVGVGREPWQEGPCYPGKREEGPLFLGGARLGSWQDNSAITAGISCSVVPCVSNKACEQISYCMLKEWC